MAAATAEQTAASPAAALQLCLGLRPRKRQGLGLQTIATPRAASRLPAGRERHRRGPDDLPHRVVHAALEVHVGAVGPHVPGDLGVGDHDAHSRRQERQ